VRLSHCSLTIPHNWVFHENDGVVSCYDPTDGVGVVQVSLFRRNPSESVKKADAYAVARAFAATKQWDLLDHDIVVRKNAADFVCVFGKKNERYWYVAHVVSVSRMALITYNCGLEDVGLETPLVESILGSFSWD
jgi:hypothetical protein